MQVNYLLPSSQIRPAPFKFHIHDAICLPFLQFSCAIQITFVCDIVAVTNSNIQDWFISPIFWFFNKDYLFINWNKLRNRPCMSSCNSTINLFCLLASFPVWTSDMFRIRLRVSKWPSQIENSQYRFQNIARFAFQY